MMVEKLLERWTLVLVAPGFELVAAIVLTVAIAVLARSFVRTATADRAWIPGVLRATAVVVIVAWGADLVAQSLWVRFPMVAWWSFALPLVLVAGGAALTALGASRSVPRAGESTMVGVRRSWWSFANRPALWICGVLVVLVVGVTIISGAVSSADERGRYIFIDFGDAGVATFYGWSYGLPVLAGLVLLGGAALVALAKIAAPPFSRSDALADELRARRVSSNAVLSASAAALSMTLGEALQVIGRAGSGSAGVGIPGVADFTWSPGYSSFAGVFVWSGWVIEVLSIVMFIALAVGAVPLALSGERRKKRRYEGMQS